MALEGDGVSQNITSLLEIAKSCYKALLCCDTQIFLCQSTLFFIQYVTLNTSVLVFHMHHITCGICGVIYGISVLRHYVNLILFTLLLVHLILRVPPHHSPSFILTI